MKKKSWILLVVCILVPVVFVGLLVVNWFVYPFTSAKPNFADVESVYNKMVVPDTWVKKGEGANKGIAGRQCPIESDGCFSKVASFTVPKSTTEEDVKSVYKSLGCISVVVDRTVQQGGGVTYADYECSSGATRVSGTLTERDEWGLTVNVATQ